MIRQRMVFTHFAFLTVFTLNTMMNAGSITISAGSDMIVNNYMSSESVIRLIAGNRISGSGHLESPIVTLTCSEFAFTGTITAHEECIIYCKKSFDYNMFSKKGLGNFTVIISPYDVVPFTKFELFDLAYNQLLKELKITHEAINNHIGTIRYYAALNQIDEKHIFELIFTEINKRIKYHKDYIIGKYDGSYTLSKLLNAVISVAGLGTLYYFYEYHDPRAYPIMLMIPALAIIKSMYSLESKESHSEKIGQLIEIKQYIEETLSNPFVLEGMQIIKLQ